MALYIKTEDGLKPQSFKGHAAGTYYDNTESGLEADNAQDAIDEVDSIKANKTNLSNYILTGTKPSTALTSGTFFVDKDGALRVATANIATTDDVGSGNSAVKNVGEVLSELNDNTPVMDHHYHFKSISQIIYTGSVTAGQDYTISNFRSTIGLPSNATIYGFSRVGVGSDDLFLIGYMAVASYYDLCVVHADRNATNIWIHGVVIYTV